MSEANFKFVNHFLL